MSTISTLPGGSLPSACSPGFATARPFFLPLLVLLPFKLLAARVANRRMNAYFQEHGIGWGVHPARYHAGGLCLHLPG